ncbi:MAG: alpha-ketoglutarate-dependent dioxygenase AlkB [Planctomycetota bacterium]|nr:alpha-ketoglutarate-dependent dioxygenase AlkB [Planctomycetota bacterium]
MGTAVEVPEQLSGASIRYCPDFLDRPDQKRLHRRLREELYWDQSQVTVFGKSHAIPRLEAWHGDPIATYRYSGTDHSPHPWTTALDEIRQLLQEFRSDLQFNSVLGNLYRDGEDAMGWHSDDEPELGENPCIASVSLGAGRDFRLRHRTNKDIDPVTIHLESGSLLLMEGTTQKCWQHSIPRRRGRNSPGERINLTFRTIRVA